MNKTLLPINQSPEDPHNVQDGLNILGGVGVRYPSNQTHDGALKMGVEMTNAEEGSE